VQHHHDQRDHHYHHDDAADRFDDHDHETDGRAVRMSPLRR
jgi:hypothetical protein